jgi:hypothetical protein
MLNIVIFGAPANTAIWKEVSHRWVMARVSSSAARSIKSMEATGSLAIVYLSSSFSWVLEIIFMTISFV